MCNNGKQFMKYPVNVTFENVGKEINTEFPITILSLTADEGTLIFTPAEKALTA